MNAKEYLGRYRRVHAQIDAKLAQIARLRALADKCAPPRGIPGGGPKGREDILGRIAECEGQIGREMDALFLVRDEIRQAVAGVGDDTHRTLLEMRYLSLMTWEAIAEAMNYGHTQLWRIHQNALSEIRLPQERGEAMEH